MVTVLALLALVTIHGAILAANSRHRGRVVAPVPVRTAPLPVTVTVSDQTPSQPDTATATFTLTLSNSLRVDPLENTTVRKGEDLAAIQVSAHGGTPDYTYAATGLPAGVTIDAATGLADILYYNKGNDVLLRARAASGSWSLTPVLDAGGRWVSRAFDADGNETLAYVKGTGLEFADL